MTIFVVRKSSAFDPYSEIAKAGDDAAELERLLRQSDQIGAGVRQAFLDSVRRLAGQVDIEQLRQLIEQGRIREAIDQIEQAAIAQGYGPFLDAVTAGTIGAARATARLETQHSGLAVRFAQTNPQAVEFLRNYEMDLIRELTDDVRASVRSVIDAGVQAGRNPLDIARDIRGQIGLTGRQSQAVQNYRRLLEQGDGDALARQLRDRRFDPSVRSHVAGTRALSDDQINNLVGRYQARYLKYRSETIARTEAKRALGSGNQLLWNQAVTDGQIGEGQVTKKWATVGDHKVRQAHVELNGQVRGLNERFTCSQGTIMYPGDPAADAGLTVNCRCAAIYRFKLRGS